VDALTIFLAENHRLVTGLHMFGFVLGFGGALISDIYFIRFIKDFKISDEELQILKGFSQIVWLGVAIIILSGLGLFLPDAESLLGSSKFLLKMLVVLVIVINGTFLNFLITPKLTSINFFDEAGKGYHPRSIRRLAFALGAVSSVSWFSAFTLGVLRRSQFSLEQMLVLYVLALSFGVIGSQIAEYLVSKKGFKFPF
jgi:hypothetical protein